MSPVQKEAKYISRYKHSGDGCMCRVRNVVGVRVKHVATVKLSMQRNEMKSSKEEFARDMEQNSIIAAEGCTKLPEKEQCAKGTGQRSSDAS